MAIEHIYAEENVLELEIAKETGSVTAGSGFKGVDPIEAGDRTQVWMLLGTGCWIEKKDHGNYYFVRGHNHMNNVVRLRLSEEEFRKIRTEIKKAGHKFPKANEN